MGQLILNLVLLLSLIAIFHLPFSKSEPVGYKQGCNETTKCAENLECFAKFPGFYRCDCPLPDYQEYDETLKACVGLEGAPCKENSVCVKNAICKQDWEFEDYFIGFCQCNDGFVGNKDGKCELSYGQPCNYTNYSNTTAALLCDQFANLVCKGEKCACPNNEELWEPERRHCSRQLQALCTDSAQCLGAANCFGKDGLPGRCTCEESEESRVRTVWGTGFQYRSCGK